MDDENFVTIYTSKICRAGDCNEPQRRKLLDYLITAIGDNATESEGIEQLHITNQDDIVIGYKDKTKAATTVNAGVYEIKVQHPDPVHVPCGPLVTSGLINHKNYRITIRHVPANLPITTISEAINSRYKVIDLEIENWSSPNRRHTPIAYGGIHLYVRCESQEEALAIPRCVEIAGHTLRLRHQGLRK